MHKLIEASTERLIKEATRCTPAMQTCAPERPAPPTPEQTALRIHHNHRQNRAASPNALGKTSEENQSGNSLHMRG